MTFAAMLACLLLQNTWVVDDNGGPGVDFTDLPPAVAAAADGDILLVQSGTYSHFTLSGKGVRILGEGAATTVVSGQGTTAWRTTIANIPAGSVAYVDRVTFSGANLFYSGPRLTVAGSTTRAVLADLVVQGSPFLFGASQAVDVSEAELHVHRCQLLGTPGCNTSFCGTPYTFPAAALRVSNGARVFVGSSLAVGGNGAWSSGLTEFAQAGNAGLQVSAGSTIPSVWIADSEVRGGNGGSNGVFGNGSSGGNGGPGIQATGSSLRVSGDSTSLVLGGDSGSSPLGCGMPGVGVATSSGASVELHSIPVTGGDTCGGPGPATSGGGITLGATPLPVLRVSGTLSTSGSATVSLSNGPPGAPFWIALSLTPGYVSAGPLFLGEILLDPTNWLPLFNGSLSGAGDSSLTLPLAGIAPGFVHLPLYLQGIALDPSGAFWRVSNSTVATIRP